MKGREGEKEERRLREKMERRMEGWEVRGRGREGES